MIKVNNETVEIRGNINQLFTETTVVLRSVRETASEMFDPVIADRMMAGLFELAKMDDSDDPWEAALTLAKKILSEN